MTYDHRGRTMSPPPFLDLLWRPESGMPYLEFVTAASQRALYLRLRTFRCWSTELNSSEWRIVRWWSEKETISS